MSDEADYRPLPELKKGAQRRRSAPFTPRTRQLVAGLALLLVGAMEYFLSTVPMAAKLPEEIRAAAGNDMILSGKALAGTIFTYAGQTGDGVDIRFDRARLSAESLGWLRAMGENVNDVEGPISWVTQSESGSKTIIEVRHTEPVLPELRLRGLQGPGTTTSQMEVQTPSAPLKVAMRIPMTPEDRSATSRKVLSVDGREIKLTGAFPLEVIVARNATFRMGFGNARGDPRPVFGLGGTSTNAGEPEGLKLLSIGVKKSSELGEPYTYFACAGPSGKVAWGGGSRFIDGHCAMKERLISAKTLELNQDTLVLGLSGTGWLQQDGVLSGVNLLDRITQNPVLAGGLILLNLALVGWLLIEVFASRVVRPAVNWSGGIFISYRRADTLSQVGRLHDHLCAHFGTERVFMDIDTIAVGEDFARKIRDSLLMSDVLLAVIGKQWLDLKDEAGRRRIDDPDDFVQTEIGIAIERGAWVIPLLVDGANVPTAHDLPSRISNLAGRNAFDISDKRFKADVSVLIAALEKGRSDGDI